MSHHASAPEMCGICADNGIVRLGAYCGDVGWACEDHAWYVRMIDQEYDQAEAEYYGQK